jgi:hypothetical protein
VRQQIAARPAVPENAWGSDGKRRQLGLGLSEAIAQEREFPNAHLLPEDRLDLLFVLDDLESVVVIDEMCEKYGLSPTDDDFKNLAQAKTLGEAVDTFLRMQERQAAIAQ